MLYGGLGKEREIAASSRKGIMLFSIWLEEKGKVLSEPVS
jgi:hypothetical protein